MFFLTHPLIYNVFLLSHKVLVVPKKDIDYLFALFHRVREKS